MKKQLTTILCLLLFQMVFSQLLKKETLASQGSSHFVYANNKSYFIQESIGQASVINTYTSSNNYSLRQGYLQPISASGINSSSDTTLDALIFPNPFTTVINIRFNEPVIDVVSVMLYDILGRAIINRQYNPEDTIVINLNDVSSGTYILRVRMRAQELTANLIRR